MRKVSTGKYNCMKGTVPLLFFAFPLLEAEKNIAKEKCLCSICWLCIRKVSRVHKYIAAAAAAAAALIQSCPTLCDPIDDSPPGSPSMGFSRQERWSGLPFPSPMHESEK